MLSAEDLNEIYLDLNKKYFGENVEVDDKINMNGQEYHIFIVVFTYISMLQEFHLQLR